MKISSCCDLSKTGRRNDDGVDQPRRRGRISGGVEDDQGEQREMKVTILAAVTAADSEDKRR